MQEVFNLVRALADLYNAVGPHRVHDHPARTSESGGRRESVFLELDRTALPDGAGSDVQEFRPVGMDDTVICVSFLGHSATRRSKQESINALRSITGMQRVLPHMAMRGTAAEVAAGEWLLQELDATSPATGNTLGFASGSHDRPPYRDVTRPLLAQYPRSGSVGRGPVHCGCAAILPVQ
jgi:hypothetical protein